jgi:folate-binding protein YgfZ
METYDISNELSVISISGVDSHKFLQGQLTNDINELDTKPFQWSAHLNNKGRMLASFIITKPAPDTYYLLTTNEIIDKIIPRLKMFVLRSKVAIERHNCRVLFSNHKPEDGLTLEIIPHYFISLSTEATVTQSNLLWKNILINNGFPLIYLKTQEEFTLQQINYDLFNGVNFKKGCYTGQEIVARTHYLGKVKRRMFRFISDNKPDIGQKVVSPQLDNQEIGVIVDFVKREHNYLGLVSLQSDCAENAFLDLENKIPLLTQAIEYPGLK